MDHTIATLVHVYRTYCVTTQNPRTSLLLLEGVLTAFDRVTIDMLYESLVPNSEISLMISHETVLQQIAHAIELEAQRTLGSAIDGLSYREIVLLSRQHHWTENQALGFAVLWATWVNLHPGSLGETIAQAYERFVRETHVTHATAEMNMRTVC